MTPGWGANEIGIDLDGSHLDSARLQENSHTADGNTFSQAADHASCDDKILHCVLVRIVCCQRAKKSGQKNTHNLGKKGRYLGRNVGAMGTEWSIILGSCVCCKQENESTSRDPLCLFVIGAKKENCQ